MEQTSLSGKLIVEHLCKAWDDRPVLKDISFTANPGEVTVLLGSSGSGKSTLLQCLNLLAPADSGSLKLGTFHINYSRLECLSVQDKRKLRTKVGMVFQRFNLWPHKSVLANLIEAPIHVLKHPKEAVLMQAYAMLQKVGMAHKSSCYPASLSGGEEQRVAIARALMMQPSVLLLDEPTSALDPEKVADLIQLLKKLQSDGGVTMVIATHEVPFARAIANTALFLENGVIAEQGTQDILFHPKTVRLKQFLQPMVEA